MDLSQVTIETERLLLVPVSTNYAEQLFLEYRDPVTDYMNHPPPSSLEVLKQRTRQKEKAMKEGTALFMAVLLKASREFLGCFSLEDFAQKTPEMGGWLKKSAHGNRYGQEAAAAMKKWADQHLDYDYIIWPCVTINTPSRRVAESLGGQIKKEYEKKTATGRVWKYVDYWLPRTVGQ